MFALYSAWYFWIPKILGVDYNRSWGKAHFWLLFIGVNVTFFPQHFLGLQGMPRRISDYPDAFAGWNLVSSFGSIISVIATWLFLYMLYVQLVEGKATSRYPWLTPEFCSDTLQTHLARAFNSLEWGLNSPPRPHCFTSLPLQSNFFKGLYNKFIILKILLHNKFVFLKYKFIILKISLQKKFVFLKLVWNNKLAFLRWIWDTRADILRGILLKLPIISACIFISLALKSFVSLGFTDLDLPTYATIQWFGIVYVIIRLTTKCWTTDYKIKVADCLLMLLVGTIFAAIMVTYLNLGMLIYIIGSGGFSLSFYEVLKSIHLPNTVINTSQASSGGSITTLAMNPNNPPQGQLVPTGGQGGRGGRGHGAGRGAGALVPSNAGSSSSSSVPGLRPPREPQISSLLQPRPVSSASTMGNVPLGTYELTEGGWTKKTKAADLQDMPEIPAKFHGCNTYVTKTEIGVKCPAHLQGEHLGYGHFGHKQSDTQLFNNLLNDKVAVLDFINNAGLPPIKGEPMVSWTTDFWAHLWDKYSGKHIQATSGEWPVWHREPSLDRQQNHDTLISIKTFGDSDKVELRKQCLYVMDTMKDVLNNPENSNTEFWKYFHEYMGVRHYYQVFLLDENTN